MLDSKQKFKGAISKKTLLIIGLVFLVGFISLFFYLQKEPTYKIVIDPEQLSPFVSGEEARANVCEIMKEGLYNEVCDNSFDRVGKSDHETIFELIELLTEIDEDNEISEYDKLLLSQAVFGALPTKDSPLAVKNISDKIKAVFNDFIGKNNIAHAEEIDSEFDEEAVRKLMEHDLLAVIGDIPAGDNAWTISINVSRYEWVNGVRQPIYSEKYGETYDPYPGVSYENKSEWEQREISHVRQRIGAYGASAKNIESGTNERVVYSFSIITWKSKKYAEDSQIILAESGRGEKDIQSRQSFSENNYKGYDMLTELLGTVSMASPVKVKKATEKNDKNFEIPEPGTPIKYRDAFKIGGTDDCYGWINDPLTGLYCFESFEKIEELANASAASGDPFKLGVAGFIHDMSPTYPYSDSAELLQEWDDCMEKNGQNSDKCEEIYE